MIARIVLDIDRLALDRYMSELYAEFGSSPAPPPADAIRETLEEYVEVMRATPWARAALLSARIEVDVDTPAGRYDAPLVVCFCCGNEARPSYLSWYWVEQAGTAWARSREERVCHSCFMHGRDFSLADEYPCPRAQRALERGAAA